MGVICPLSPEVRALNRKNKQLIAIIKQQLKGLEHYDFSNSVKTALKTMQPRYKYNEGILEDIQKLHTATRNSHSPKSDSASQDLEDALKNSCLILQNEANLDNQAEQKIPGMQNSESFCKNYKKNQSLIEQINILYKKQIHIEEYSQSLYFFLKWANMFQEHSFGGFLKPLYRQFISDIVQKSISQFNDVVTEIQMFGQFMIAVVTQIYGLKIIASQQPGKLIKNDNIYNLIMCCLFKKIKLRKFVVECINYRDKKEISLYQKQLKWISKKPINFFGVNSKFTLQKQCSATESEKTTTSDFYNEKSYSESLKLVEQLCHTGSPITKLKTIIAISKQITRQIKVYYQKKNREAPEIDPDNLMSVIMYLLAKSGNKLIYQQLKIVQNFTTFNCLNCISGYYLKLFMGAAETIIQMKQQ